VSASPERRLGLDALRGVAVFLMIEQHMGVWLWRGPDPGRALMDYPALLVFNALGGGAAPLFVTLAGLGCSLMILKRAARSVPSAATLVRRGAALIGFGVLLNVITPSWFTWRTWFVLHLMGLGMMLAPVLHRLSTRGLLLLAAALLAATPFVQVALGTPSTLTNLRMSGILEFGPDGPVALPWAVPRLAIAEGQFPIFPWLSFFVFGLAVGRWVARGQDRPITMLGLACLGTGGILAAVGSTVGPDAPLLWRATRLPVPFFPASPALIALLAGGVVLAIRLTRRFEHRLHPGAPIVTLGRASLTLLIMHVWLFRELTRPLELWRALSPGAALATMLGFVAFATWASTLWRKVDYKYGAEWLLRRAG
jgi:uncharacterized membrane protein